MQIYVRTMGNCPSVDMNFCKLHSGMYKNFGNKIPVNRFLKWKTDLFLNLLLAELSYIVCAYAVKLDEYI